VVESKLAIEHKEEGMMALRLEDPEAYAAFVAMWERYRRRKKEGKKHD
jgi:hypothetical protein